MGKLSFKPIISVIKQITAEPALLIYVIAADLQGTTSNALWYQKVCMSLYHDEWICENINSNETLKEKEEAVSAETSEWLFYNKCVSSLLGLVSVFVYGQLSDRVRRKIAILSPFIGACFDALIFLFGAVYIESPLAFLLVGSFMSGVSGGYTSLLMGIVSYISSIAGPEKKTFRISLMYGCSSAASLLAFAFSGVLFDATGFVVMYGLSIILYMLGILYVVFILKDIKNATNKKKVMDNKNDLKEADEKSSNILKDLWDNVKAVFYVALEPRKYNDRVHIFVLMLIIIFDMLASGYSITYLFLKHPPLSYSQTLYGFYSANGQIARSLCLFCIVPILKTLKTKDTVLLLIALTSYSVEQIMLGFSTEQWMPFVASWVGIMYGCTFVTIRGMLANMVRIDELGKIFALMAAVENIGTLLNSAFYNYFLFPLTIDLFAGFCYIFGAVLLIVPISMTGWLHFDFKKYSNRHKNLNEDLTELQDDFDGMEITTINALSAGDTLALTDQSNDDSNDAYRY